jgi:hypothetical protein
MGRYLFTPYAPFSPVIEKGSNPFLSESPYELIAKGQIEDLPWIVSNTAHEGMLPGACEYHKYSCFTPYNFLQICTRI